MPARKRVREGVRAIGAKYINVFRKLTDALRNALYVKVASNVHKVLYKLTLYIPRNIHALYQF